MAKIDENQILKTGVELKREIIDFNSDRVKTFVVETKKKQEEILNFKKVDQDKLKLVIQLF